MIERAYQVGEALGLQPWDHGKLDGPRVRYRKTDRGWVEVEGRRGPTQPVLVVDQGPNLPQRLVAVDRARNRRWDSQERRGGLTGQSHPINRHLTARESRRRVGFSHKGCRWGRVKARANG